MRGILIDPSNKTITEVEYNGDYRTIAPMIGAASGLFDLVRYASNVDVFVDDEGLLYNGGNPHGYFRFYNPAMGMDSGVLAGKALMLGNNRDGASCGCRLSLDTVRRNVQWLVQADGVFFAEPIMGAGV